MRMSNRAGLIAALVLLVLLILTPQIAPLLHLAISVCTEVLLFAIAAMAVNLLIGYTGVLPFGNAAFFGLGAYGAGLTIQFWHVKFFSSIGLGVLAALIGAFLIGPFLLRRRGILFWLLVRSPFGRSLIAIKENETRARYLGLDTDRFIFVALLISAAIEGLAGACYGLSIMFADPLQLDWHQSGNFVLMTILGGSGTIFGPFIGSLIFVIGSDILSSAIPWWQIPLGALFVVCVLGFPKGILGTILDALEKRRGGFGYEARDTLHGTVASEREIQP
jgi:ABC-type branched-subunit amino acid transport system permease subunit